MSARLRDEQIAIKGKIHYGSFTVDLDQAVGAFNRRDHFVQMGNGHVALLPTSLEQLPLQELAEECETVGDEIRIKRTQFHIFDAISQTVPTISVEEQLQTLRNNLANHQQIDSVVLPNDFHGILRPYQQEGLNWLDFLYKMNLNGILADDMGLGKTIQVIAFLSTLKTKGPILVVMPTSLIFNWKRELETFLPSAKCLVHQGAQREQSLEALENDHIILTTYTTLRMDLPLFSRMHFHCVILDEAQAIKNAQTQTFQAVCRLKASFRLSMTGTPIENHLMELWSHLQFLQPGLLGTQESFQAEIQAGASDMRFVQRIRKKVRPFMLRRTKDQVAKDLPEKIEQTVWVELGPEQRILYDRFLSGVKQGVLKKIAIDGLGAARMEVLEALLRLRQICCHPLLIGQQDDLGETAQSAKLESLMNDLEQSHEEGKKAIVYSQFTSMLSLISKACKERRWNFVMLDGTTKDREQVVDKFQNDPETTLFLISLKAGGAGLNLTAADHVFLFDPWWNQAVENQAIDRAHRIGQTKTIVAKRYIAIETVEEKMMTLKSAKKNLSTELIDGDPSASPLSAEDFMYLLS
jgi:SNF2 family DNA or RNA helicase